MCFNAGGIIRFQLYNKKHMGLIEDINRPEETPLHSSGYAEVANGDGIGAASPETFNQRKSLAGSRQIVGTYDKSFLGSGFAPPEVRSPGAAKPKSRFQKAPKRGIESLDYRNQQRQAMNSKLNIPARPTTGFREPPTRNYNPYA